MAGKSFLSWDSAGPSLPFLPLSISPFQGSNSHFPWLLCGHPCTNFDSIVDLHPRTARSNMMLCLVPSFHPSAVCDEVLIQSYSDNSKNLPGDLPGVFIPSWDLRIRIASSAHHVLLRRSKSHKEAQAALVRFVYLRKHRAPFDVPLAHGLNFNILLYPTRRKISYCDGIVRVETFTWLGAPDAWQNEMSWAQPILGAEFWVYFLMYPVKSPSAPHS